MFDKSLITENRLASAKKKEMTPLRLYPDDNNAFFGGSTGGLYFTTLDECQCADFAINGRMQPCKHMIRLAMELGMIDNSGMESDETAARAKYQLSRMKQYIREEPIAKVTLFVRPLMNIVCDGEYPVSEHRFDDVLDINGIENSPIFKLKKNGDMTIDKKYKKEIDNVLDVARNRYGDEALARIEEDDLIEILGRNLDLG